MPRGHITLSLGLTLQAPKLCQHPTKLHFEGRRGSVFPAQAAPETPQEQMLQPSPEPRIELLIQTASPPFLANPLPLDPFVLTSFSGSFTDPLGSSIDT